MAFETIEDYEQFRLGRDCLNKVRHRGRRGANIAVTLMGSRAKGTKPYRCPHCDGWYLGHPKEMKKDVA